MSLSERRPQEPAALDMDAGRARLAILAAAWAVFVLAVYCPDVGRGFVKDDFTWIRAAKSAIAQPAHLIVPKERAFYRPLVTASFALDYASHRWQPRGYGWTNVALYVACTAAVGILAFAIGLSEYAAILAAFLWAVIPHGVNMAVLWVEGARVSQRTLVAIRSNADALPKRGRIVLADERGATVSNFRNAFGDLRPKRCRPRSIDSGKQ